MKRRKAIDPNLICVIIFVILSVVSLFAGDIFASVSGGTKYLILAAATIICFLIPTIIITKSSGEKASVFLKTKRFKMRQLPLVIFTAFTVCLLSMMLNALMYKVTGKYFGDALANPVSSIDWDYAIEASLAVIIAPAVFEELFFRGAYLSHFRPGGEMKAIFGSAVCFALMHSSPYNLAGPLIAGFAYGMLTLFFDSVYPAIICHLINNFLSCIIVFYAPTIEKAGLSGFAAISGLIMLLLFAYLMLASAEPYLVKIKDPQKKSLTQRKLNREYKRNIFSMSFLILAGLFMLKLIAIFLNLWG